MIRRRAWLTMDRPMRKTAERRTTRRPMMAFRRMLDRIHLRGLFMFLLSGGEVMDRKIS
jgi:hypothetical protein